MCDEPGVEGGHMGEWEMECLDCGWRGMVSELTDEAYDSSVWSPVSCPDCGGSEFEQGADKDGKENA